MARNLSLIEPPVKWSASVNKAVIKGRHEAKEDEEEYKTKKTKTKHGEKLGGVKKIDYGARSTTKFYNQGPML
jgi:hypothetical protein